MKLRLILLIVLSMILGNTIAMAKTHPYLFFSSSDIVNLQSIATTSVTRANQIWNLILTSQANFYANNTTTIGYHDPNDNQKMIWTTGTNELASYPLVYENIYSLALAYTITSNETYLTALRTALWGDGHNVPIGLLFQQFSSIWHGSPRPLGLALIYDLLYNTFSDTERTRIKAVIKSDLYFGSGNNDGLRWVLKNDINSTPSWE